MYEHATVCYGNQIATCRHLYSALCCSQGRSQGSSGKQQAPSLAECFPWCTLPCLHACAFAHWFFFFFFLLKEGFAVEPKLGFELSLSCPTLKSIFILPVAIEYLRVPVFVAIKFQFPFYLHGCVAISRFVSFSFLIFETRLMRYTLAFENLVLDHVWILE